MYHSNLTDIEKQLIQTRKSSAKKAKRKSSRNTALTSRQVKKKATQLKQRNDDKYVSKKIKKDRRVKETTQLQSHLEQSTMDDEIELLEKETRRKIAERLEKKQIEEKENSRQEEHAYFLENVRTKFLQELSYEKDTLLTKERRIEDDLTAAFEEEKQVDDDISKHKQSERIHAAFVFTRRNRTRSKKHYPCEKCKTNRFVCKLERRQNIALLNKKEIEVHEKILSLQREKYAVFSLYDQVDLEIEVVRMATHHHLELFVEIREQRGITNHVGGYEDDYDDYDDDDDYDGW